MRRHLAPRPDASMVAGHFADIKAAGRDGGDCFSGTLTKRNDRQKAGAIAHAALSIDASVSVVGKVLIVDASFPMSAPAPALSREGSGDDTAVDNDPDDIAPALGGLVISAPGFRLG